MENKEILGKRPYEPVTDEAMERLAKIMNDSPTLLKLRGTEWEIRGLKPGTQWKIAEEACKIVKNENMAMGDVIKQFAVNMPAVAKVIALALLNDKEKIEHDLQRVYDALLWGDYELRDWATILFEILGMIDVDFFLASTDAVKTIRTMTLERKMTMEELKSSRHAQSTGR